jgi:hypothetical protein
LAPPSSPCADGGAIVERAAAYVAQFAQDLTGVIATEDYQQEVVGVAPTPTYQPPPITVTGNVQVQPATPMTTRPSLKQSLRSAFLFVRLSSDEGWVGFRDVLEVNGKRVGDARPRTPLEVVGEASLERWRRLSEESARYNIGSIQRTLNVPTFALLVLFPGNVSRFAFTVVDERTGAAQACAVAFQETSTPTIVRSGVGGDLPASGAFLVDAATGRVRRSELLAGRTSTGVASKSVVQYALERRLQLWLPHEMREEYVDRSGERVHCVARYSGYRRAEVTATIRPGP